MEVKYKIFRVDLTHEYVPDGYSTAHLAHPNLRDGRTVYQVYHSPRGLVYEGKTDKIIRHVTF